jgi:hypothetical protein
MFSKAMGSVRFTAAKADANQRPAGDATRLDKLVYFSPHSLSLDGFESGGGHLPR